MTRNALPKNKETEGFATGNVQADKSRKIPSLWNVLGPLAFLIFYCESGWKYLYVTVRNCPTILLRRYHVFCFFTGIQYFWLFPFLQILVFCLPILILFLFFPHSQLPPLFLLLYLFIGPFCSACIVLFPFWVKYKKNIKDAILHDLGFSVSSFNYLSFRRLERRLCTALLVNILIFNIVGYFIILKPTIQGGGDLLKVIVAASLYTIAALFFYMMYLLGRKLLELCRTPEDLIQSPPLIDNPFSSLVYGKRNQRNQVKQSNQLFRITFSIAILCFLVAFAEWRYNPILLAICITAICVTYYSDLFFTFSNKFKWFRERQDEELYKATLCTIFLIGFYILGILQNENLSLDTFIFQSLYGLILYPTICLCLCILFSVFCIINLCVWFWRLVSKNMYLSHPKIPEKSTPNL